MLPFLTWLIQGAVGPALVGLPFAGAATGLAGAAKQWFQRLRRSDGLSQIVQAAIGGGVDLSDAEFAAVRRLLEQEGTWELVGDGTVEDLALRIASCLPDRADGASLAAGRAIAAGLLEFAICDLEPEWFQKVLLARLDRLENDQASALDRAMLTVHADLAALSARQEADDLRFARVMGQLGRMLDRLPHGPADQREVTVYLVTLIRWLSIDPWPDDTSFRGPVLTPASIERKLWIADGGASGDRDLDADDLSRQCIRLVVLGGPGSGKTWLARRTARLCAEAALDALEAGAGLGEVELPLYTTCARLAAAPPSDGIRRAIVDSALGQLPDLGGSRVIDALRMLFEERDGPTLLVADSLDEARGPDDRIRQADTLSAAWRIVLTSRPGSWNRQLSIRDADPSRRIGLLQPLQYPDDVEPLIAAWFSGRPARAEVVAAQIRDRPALQQTATVPLLLAFYCIIGGDQPLPARQAELYKRVVKRMLTGRWRGSGIRDPDPDACLETLRDWAISAADSNPLSGVGEWLDEFFTPRVRQAADDRDALDHVAVPLGHPDLDSGKTRRRFVHRSIQEHMVAEHVALRMAPREAAAELIDHLWYDLDWEYAAPAALAMHPQHEQVLQELICRVTRGDQLVVDLAAIDGCWEIRRFLARVAQESSEGDWSPEVAKLIGQARTDLVTSRPRDLGLVLAPDWPTSNRLIIERLLERLSRTSFWEALELTGAVTRLAVTPQDRAPVRLALLVLLARETNSETALALAEAVFRLAVTPQDQAPVRQVLLALLADKDNRWLARALAEGLTRLAVTSEDRALARAALLERLARETNRWAVRALADGVARLAVTSEDRALARAALLERLAREANPEAAVELARVVSGLNPVPQDRASAGQALLALFASKPRPVIALELAAEVARLDSAPQDRASARAALLARLARQTNPEAAWPLAEAVTWLAVTPQERALARAALLALLTRKTSPGRTAALAKAITRLADTPQDRASARTALLERLTTETNHWAAQALAEAVTQMAVTPQDRASARAALLALLARKTSPGTARALAEAVAGLDPAPQDRAAAGAVLLARLANETNPWAARALAEAITHMAVTPQDRASAQAVLLARLDREADPWLASALAKAVTQVAVTPLDRGSARQALLTRLIPETDPWIASALAKAVAELDCEPQDWAPARQELLARLDREADPWIAGALAEAVAGLDPAPEERAPVKQTLLARLVREFNIAAAIRLAEAVARLDPSPQDRLSASQALIARLTPRNADQQTTEALANTLTRLAVTPQDRTSVRQALLARLAHETNSLIARVLAEMAAGLSPTAADLIDSANWPLPPAVALVAAVRRNSALPAWLDALPLLFT